MTDAYVPAGAVTRCLRCQTDEGQNDGHDSCDFGGWVPVETTYPVWVTNGWALRAPAGYSGEKYETRVAVWALRVCPGDEVLYEGVPLIVVSVAELTVKLTGIHGSLGMLDAEPIYDLRLIVGGTPNLYRLGDMRLPGGDD